MTGSFRLWRQDDVVEKVFRMTVHCHSERSDDNSEGERCKNEFTHFYNRAKELVRQHNPVKS